MSPATEYKPAPDDLSKITVDEIFVSFGIPVQTSPMIFL
jgi:hypothetical protein